MFSPETGNAAYSSLSLAAIDLVLAGLVNYIAGC